MPTRFFLTICLSIGTAQTSWAQNATLSYQGHMANAAGQLVTACYPMTFTLYASREDDEPLWRGSLADVDVLEGTFNVDLGQAAPFPTSLGSHEALNLGIHVNDGQRYETADEDLDDYERSMGNDCRACARCPR